MITMRMNANLTYFIYPKGPGNVSSLRNAVQNETESTKIYSIVQICGGLKTTGYIILCFVQFGHSQR